MMMRHNLNKLFYPVIFIILVMLNGCTPSPKYHGQSRPSRSEEHVREAEHIRETPAVMVDFRPPVENFSRNRITSNYGVRKHPEYNIMEFHRGIDIKTAMGERIFASAAGTVIFSGRQSGFGKVVIIDHGQRLFTVYAHLSSIGVNRGITVDAGEPIGRAGDTGNANGVHLHFEIRKEGKTLDPLKYL